VVASYLDRQTSDEQERRVSPGSDEQEEESDRKGVFMSLVGKFCSSFSTTCYIVLCMVTHKQ
jgi:hypothetical protein